MKTHRRTERTSSPEFFFSSVIFVRFCAAQKRMILLNNIIFVKCFIEFLEGGQTHGKNEI